MLVVQKKISDLKKAEYNPRRMNEKEAADLTESIKRFGFAEPIVVNNHIERQNVIVGGNHRVEVAKLLGMTEVPVVYVTLDLEQEQELNLRLNKNLGQWDENMLANFNEDLLKEVGFESKELDKLFDITLPKDIDEVPPTPKEAESKLGEVYELGPHRLMCGNALNKEDVDKLMDGKKADMIFTDPPYNVGFDYETYKDDKDEEEWVEFCRKWFEIAKEVSDYITFTCGQGNVWIFYQLEKTLNTLTWHKKFSLSNGFVSHAIVVEPILVYGRPKKRYDTDYFSIATEREKGLRENHPCPKPIALIVELIVRGVERDKTVLDLFGGSGSTLIACEQKKRVCYMMELDPKYCDVIRKRYNDFVNL